MPAAKKRKKKAPAPTRKVTPPPEGAPGRRLSQEMFALILLVLDVFLILSLVSYNPADLQVGAATAKVAGVSNWAGKVGAMTAGWLMGGIGLVHWFS
ncbi:MAG: hypothetical protein FJ135_12890 [Deltaproteobacteria bacterium]|nr:hypothetical protein [Deltaproteobacteria bacterium]